MDRTITDILDSFESPKQIKWRHQQRESVEEICKQILSGTSDIILDAPTGTGKSLIAIAASYVLRELHKDSYILVSDLELQSQYEEDFKEKRLYIPSIKGVDNYICDDNDQRVSHGTCNLQKLQKKKLTCYSTCGYYSARDRAIEANVSLLNYSYWLIQMNYVNLRFNVNSFNVRDVCFLDEAHKLDLIVHNHFAPRINDSLLISLQSINHKIKHYQDIPIRNIIDSIRRTNNTKEIMSLMKDLKDILFYICESIKTYLAAYSFGEIPTTDEILMLNSFERIKDVFCKVQDFEELVVQDKSLVTKTLESNEINLNYLDSQQMLSVFFQRYTKQRVFMSATWGNIEKSSSFLGIKNYEHIKVDNVFDWSSSSYNVVGKHSLTYHKREENLVKAIKDLDVILEKYPKQRGIIHTGSYAFSDEILMHSKFKDRFTMYKNSEEKSRALLAHKLHEDSILLGPSLLEGINLPDELCNFIIFFKCPYMGLSSDFIGKKVNLYPEWYDWKTALLIEQGCGRGMRHKDDKCDVWFIDASFVKFFHQKHEYLSKEFIDRTLDPLDKLLL